MALDSNGVRQMLATGTPVVQSLSCTYGVAVDLQLLTPVEGTPLEQPLFTLHWEGVLFVHPTYANQFHKLFGVKPTTQGVG